MALSTTQNNYLSTNVFGALGVYSYTGIPACIKNSGDTYLKGNIYLGNETVDLSGNYTDTSGNIIVKIQGTQYIITPSMLINLSTLSTTYTSPTAVSSLITTALSPINTALTNITTNMNGITYISASDTTNFTNTNVILNGNVGIGNPLNSKTNTFYGTNTFIGTANFNYNLPTSSITPSSGTQFITKNYADSTYSTSSISTLLSLNNAWTGSNSFNTLLPTSSITPSSGTQLITKTYADTTFSTSSTVSSAISSALGSYITSSSLATTLASYITSSSLTTTLASYITSSSLTTTLASYITSSSLTTTLASYVLSSTYTANNSILTGLINSNTNILMTTTTLYRTYITNTGSGSLLFQILSSSTASSYDGYIFTIRNRNHSSNTVAISSQFADTSIYLLGSNTAITGYTLPALSSITFVIYNGIYYQI